jgi:uncharacterized delta-60 repeat protein
MNTERHCSIGATKPLPYKRTTRFHILVKMTAMLLLLLAVTARMRAQSPLDGFDPNANGRVHVVVVQPDGKILLGGGFTTLSPNGGPAVTRNRIARLNPDGTLDTAFNPNANGFVDAIALQADGKVLVGGSFNGIFGIGGQNRNFIARLDATTGLADSFNVHANAPVLAIVVQADGKILVGGQFDVIGGFQRQLMARLDATTGAADSFNPNPNVVVTSIALQADGKILAAGHFTNIGGQPRHRLARLDATTGLADSFNPDANAPVKAITVQADGHILAGGSFTSIGGQPRNRIARLDSTTGSADSFDPNANNTVNAIAIAADGKILVGGLFEGANSIGGRTRNHLAQINPATGLADLFDPNANGEVLSIAPQADGKFLAGGVFTTFAPNGGSAVIRNHIARLETTPGTLGNLSTRLRVQTGDNAMIGGFIITGTEPKTVVVRGLGPSLPVPGALADPVIEVHGPSGELLGANDNWNDALTRQQVIDSGLAPSNDLESALWGTINPGAYTVVVRGANQTTGIALFEVYDLDRAADSQLANISTRGFVETGDNVLIGGTIIVGSTRARVLFRALGPSLTNFGVANALEDPVLELYDGNGGVIAVNHNWRNDQEVEILATGIPPSNDLEAAIVRDLAPGSYTAIVRGADNSTGVALVEAYGLN